MSAQPRISVRALRPQVWLLAGGLFAGVVVLLIGLQQPGAAKLTAALPSPTPRPRVVAARSPTAAAARAPARPGATPLPPLIARFQPPATPGPPPSPAPTRPPDDLLRLVTKQSALLPQDYVPPDLEPLPNGASDPPGLLMRHEAAQAFAHMVGDARRQGLVIVAVSTYRSFEQQARVYDDEVETVGKVQADRESASPGRSEHQLGTAADVSSPRVGDGLDDSFDQTPEGAWLLQHAVDYGFVLSYPDGKEAITGYRFEPWHFRYLGVNVAHAIVASGLTSTEVLGAHQSVGDEAVSAPPQPTP